MNNREKAAEIIEGYYPECPNCPVGIPEVGECSECARICKVIADDLAAAGVLAPDLPAPTWEHSTTWDVPGECEWQTDTHKGEVMLEVDIEEPGHFAPLTTSELWVMKRDEARALALALLAAAAHAQKEEANE